MSLPVILGIWLMLGVGSAFVANAQGKSPVGAFFGGLMIPLAVVAIAWVFIAAFGVLALLFG